MKAVGIKALKNELSHYLRLVRAGEVVLITDRDQVVAELRLPTTPHVSLNSRFDAFINQLVREGTGRKAKEEGEIEPILKRAVRWEGISAIDALNSSREERA